MVLTHDAPSGFDVSLVRRACAGDAEAFTTLMERHTDPVRRLVRRFVRDGDDARDVEQDTWIRAAKNLDSLSDGNRFEPWVKAIARNTSLNYLSSQKRTSQRVTTFEVLGTEEFEDEAAPTPEAAVLSKDNQQKVWQALGSLSERDRNGLFLREYKGLPYSEIAVELGISKNAAEVCVHRARERFRQAFAQVEQARPECGVDGLRLSTLLEAGDTETPPTSRLELEAHVESCDDCRQRLATMTEGRTLYRNLGVFGLPIPGFGWFGGLLAKLGNLVGLGGTTAGAATGTTASASAASAAGVASAATTTAITGGTVTAGTVVAGGATATAVTAAGIGGALSATALAATAAAAIVVGVVAPFEPQPADHSREAATAVLITPAVATPRPLIVTSTEASPAPTPAADRPAALDQSPTLNEAVERPAPAIRPAPAGEMSGTDIEGALVAAARPPSAARMPPANVPPPVEVVPPTPAAAPASPPASPAVPAAPAHIPPDARDGQLAQGDGPPPHANAARPERPESAPSEAGPPAKTEEPVHAKTSDGAGDASEVAPPLDPAPTVLVATRSGPPGRGPDGNGPPGKGPTGDGPPGLGPIGVGQQASSAITNRAADRTEGNGKGSQGKGPRGK